MGVLAPLVVCGELTEAVRTHEGFAWADPVLWSSHAYVDPTFEWRARQG